MELTDQTVSLYAEQLGTSLYALRKSRETHPEGRSDGKRWYASGREMCRCCKDIRSPSAAFPWSQMTHCRSKKHCVSLFRENFRDELPADALLVLCAFEQRLRVEREQNPAAPSVFA